jgi:hypothetical protein
MVKCQACRTRFAEIVESDESESHPYVLCSSCYNRLINTTLRPLEYFNLKAIHGDTPSLSEYLYDENGVALKPSEEVVHKDSLAFPKLENIKDDCEMLISYSILRWNWDEEAIYALEKFDKAEILFSLNRRINENRELSDKIYDLASIVLGPYADDWIRAEWRLRDKKYFYVYAEALARCLPVSEGFYYFTEAIHESEKDDFYFGNISSLRVFQYKGTLDWIENNVPKDEKDISRWSLAAAVSQLDWARVKKWISMGPPLGIIALDCLVYCIASSMPREEAFWKNDPPAILHDPDTIENMNEVLDSYTTKDDNKNVKLLIETLKKNWHLILHQEKQEQEGTEVTE